MKWHIPTAAVIALCSSFLFAAEPGNQPPGKDLAEDTAELFRLLRQESPALYQHLEKKPRTEVLQKIAAALDCGIRPVSAAAAPGKTVPGKSGKCRLYPARLIDGNQILYLRLDALTPETLAQMKKDITQADHLANPYHGLILDLRSAAGNLADAACVKDFLAMLRKGKTAAAILRSENTAGAPELFTAAAKEQHLAVTMGTAGTGELYPVKQVNGWQIPVVPENLPFVSPESRQPMIPFPAMPQISYDMIGKRPAVSDPAIRRASDLLKSLHAIRPSRPAPESGRESGR